MEGARPPLDCPKQGDTNHSWFEPLQLGSICYRNLAYPNYQDIKENNNKTLETT